MTSMFELAVFAFDLFFWWFWMLRWFVKQFAFLGNTYLLGKQIPQQFAYANNSNVSNLNNFTKSYLNTVMN